MSCYEKNNIGSVNETFIIEPLLVLDSTLTACTGVYTNMLTSCSGSTAILMGTTAIILSGDTYANSISATTINASIIYSGGTNLLDLLNAVNPQVTGGTFNSNNGTLYISKNNGSIIPITGFTDYYLTGITFNNDVLSLTNNSGDTISTTINNFNVLSATTISATTFYGDGSNLTNIPNFYTTGGTKIGNVIYFDRTDALSAYTINIGADGGDTYITGGTFNSNTLSLVNNSGSTVTITGFTDIFITGGTFSSNTLSLVNNSGGTVTVTGFTDNDRFLTGGTFASTTLSLRDNSGSTVTVTGFTSGGSGTSITGGTFNSNTLSLVNNSGTTVTITGFTDNDRFITGGTFTKSASTLSLVNNSGTTVTITGFTDNDSQTFQQVTDNGNSTNQDIFLNDSKFAYDPTTVRLFVGDGLSTNNGNNTIGIGQGSINNNIGTNVIGIGFNSMLGNEGSDVISIGDGNNVGNLGSNVISIGKFNNGIFSENRGNHIISIGYNNNNGESRDGNNIIAIGANIDTNVAGDDGNNIIALGFGSTFSTQKSFVLGFGSPTESVAFNANFITSERVYILPDANGTLTLSVNGVTPDDYGNIALSISGASITGGTFTKSASTLTLRDNSSSTVTITGFTDNDRFLTGGTFASTTLSLRDNSGSTVTITGFTSGGGGASITGGTFTKSASTLSLRDNSGTTVSVTGFTDIFLTGGTFASTTLSLRDNSGSTVTITGFTDNDRFITGGTFNSNTLSLVNNSGSTVTITGFTSPITIYSGNDSLISNRTVNVGSNFLAFSSNTNPNMFFLSGNSLGIGKIPTGLYQLDVSGNVRLGENTLNTLILGSGLQFDFNSSSPRIFGNTIYIQGVASSGSRIRMGVVGGNTPETTTEVEHMLGDLGATAGTKNALFVSSRLLHFSGNQEVNHIFVRPIHQASVSSIATNMVRGFYYHPVYSAPKASGVTEIAFENAHGDNLFNSTNGNTGIGFSGTPTHKLHVSGSSNLIRFEGLGSGSDSLVLTTDISGVVRTRTVASISGGGSGASITGGTFTKSASTLTLTDNSGSTVTVTGFTDIFLTGGTFNSNTLSLVNNSGSTVTITGFTDTFLTGGTYTAGTATFTNNTGGTFNVGGFLTGVQKTITSGIAAPSGGVDGDIYLQYT